MELICKWGGTKKRAGELYE